MSDFLWAYLWAVLAGIYTALWLNEVLAGFAGASALLCIVSLLRSLSEPARGRNERG